MVIMLCREDYQFHIIYDAQARIYRLVCLFVSATNLLYCIYILFSLIWLVQTITPVLLT